MTTDVPPPAANRGSRRIIFGLVVLLAIGGAATALVYNYAASGDRPGAAVVFQIDRGDPILPASRGEFVRHEFEDYRQSQIAMVVSRGVINTVLNDPEVKQTPLIREADPDAIRWLETNLRVSSDPSSSFIRVELDGENTAEVLTVLNAVVKAYLQVSSHRDSAQRVRRLRELEMAAKKCEMEVKFARSELSKMGELIGGTSYGLLHIRTEEELADEIKIARKELRRVRLERGLLEANLPTADEPRWQPQIAAVGGAVVAGFAGSQTPDRSRAHIMKELDIREQLWITEMKEAEELLVRRSRYSGEVQELKNRIELKAGLLRQIGDENERCKLDLGSGSRVSVVDEPHARPRRP